MGGARISIVDVIVIRKKINDINTNNSIQRDNNNDHHSRNDIALVPPPL